MSLLPRLDSLSSEEIKDIIDEYNHQLFHLERSQKELKAYIDEDPEDRDLKTAYEENIDVIDRRKDAIAVMIKYLEENDPAFDKSMVNTNFDHLANRRAAVGSVSASVQSLTIDDANTEDEAKDNGEDDRGMYI